MRVTVGRVMALAVLACACTGCARNEAAWYESIARTTPPSTPGEDPAERLSWDTMPDRELAMRVLLRTATFTDIAIGAEGATPVQVRSLGVLLDQPDAPRIFRVLLKHAAPAGQMFALCGLYLVDRPHFDRVVGAFRSDRRRLQTQDGCGGSLTTVAELVQRRGPAIHVPPGHEADPEFYNEFGGNTRYIDIIGGGWPEIFRTALARMDDKGAIRSPDEPPTPDESLFGETNAGADPTE